MVDVNDKKGLKQLTWAVYDGVLLPGDPLQLQGQHDWAWIIVGTYPLVFWEKCNFDTQKAAWVLSAVSSHALTQSIQGSHLVI